jgi:hypothetical protein
VAVAAFLLQAPPLLLSFIAAKPAAAFEQRHLGWEVAALAHLNAGITGHEGHVVAAAIGAGSNEPERSCHRALAVVTFRCK